ncbi:MAG: adenine deaminase, partial [Calditrichaeota bacterium]
HPNDILNQGHINYMIRTAVDQGIPPVSAIRMATLNPAEYFCQRRLGAVAPGRIADLVVFDDFRSMTVHQVYKNGQLVAQDGRALYQEKLRPKVTVRSSMNIRWLEGDEFVIPAQGEFARVIEVVPDQIVTNEKIMAVKRKNGLVESDVDRDILKLFVIERHRASGNVGRGLIHGFGLKQGAIATSIAHDSHNIIVVGTNDRDIFKAVTTINKMGGGIAVVVNEQVLEKLELPIAGLMSDQTLEVVSAKMDDLIAAAHSLGVTLDDPIMTLSFMALPVIPQLKLTDLGLVNVEKFQHIDLFVQ